jgi:xanthine dehydrogenase YagS FAD-binding subunit
MSCKGFARKKRAPLSSRWQRDFAAYDAILGGGPSYIVHPSDTAPALVALDARITIAGPAGERTMLLEKFFVLPAVDFRHENILKPGEIVTEIFVPAPKTGSKRFYHKVRERKAWNHPIVSVATVVQSSGGAVLEARVVLGCVAPIPWRSPKAEAFLRGNSIRLPRRRLERSPWKARNRSRTTAIKVGMAKALVQRGLLASV